MTRNATQSDHNRQIGRMLAFQDPAFDPQPDFAFEMDFDNEGSHTIRGSSAQGFLPHSVWTSDFDGLEGSSVLKRFDSTFTAGPLGATPGSGGWSGQTDGDPDGMVDNPHDSPLGTAFGAGHAATYPPSAQSELVQGDSATVDSHYGQITPPEDVLKSRAAPKDAPKARAPENSDVKLNKSERARNAANQRHNKARNARKDSLATDVHDHGGEVSSTEEKKEKYREKNRVAAAKCRSKKRQGTDRLETEFRELQTINKGHKAEVQLLKNELNELRSVALHHVAGRCPSRALHEYNEARADVWRNFLNSGHPPAIPEDTPSQTSVTSSRESPTAEEMGPSSMVHLQPFAPADPSWMEEQSYANHAQFAFARTLSPEIMGAGSHHNAGHI